MSVKLEMYVVINFHGKDINPSFFQECWNCGRNINGLGESCNSCNKAKYCDFFCLLKDSEKHVNTCEKHNEPPHQQIVPRTRSENIERKIHDECDSTTDYSSSNSETDESEDENVESSICQTVENFKQASEINASLKDSVSSFHEYGTRPEELSPYSKFLKQKLKEGTSI